MRGSLRAPFLTAIKLLRGYITDDTPYGKLDILYRVIREIEQSVGRNVQGSDAVLAGDDLMPIIVYIISQSRAPELLFHLDFAHTYALSALNAPELAFASVTFQVILLLTPTLPLLTRM